MNEINGKDFGESAPNLNCILLGGVPMPPSSNHQYILARRGGKTFHTASQELKDFKLEMLNYFRSSIFTIEYRNRIDRWLKEKLRLEINCVFFFHEKKLFTQKNTVKKLDVSNRIKALHDCLSEFLGFDDSLFFKISAEKCIGSSQIPENVAVEIKPLS